MEGIEKFWKAESPVESLHAVIADFYHLMCETDFPESTENVLNANPRDYFAYACRCGETHLAKRSFWRNLVNVLVANTPAPERPERTEYHTVFRSFCNDTRQLDLRKMLMPFILETGEGKLIEEALAIQNELIAELIQRVCSSPVTLNTVTDLQTLFVFTCVGHQSTHYLKSSDYKQWHKEITAEAISGGLDGNMSHFARSIVVQRSSLAQQEFTKEFRPTRIQNPALMALPKKKKTPTKKGELQQVTSTQVQTLSENANQKPMFANSNLYILTPNLMSDDWLIEYNVCGRKTSYKTQEEAESAKVLHSPQKRELRSGEEKTTYHCRYCSEWHFGRDGGKRSTNDRLARNGLYWYRKDHKKANAFIHKIIFEEWDK